MAINATEFLKALEEIEIQKGISKEVTIKALEEAMAKGFRKQLGGDDALVRVTIDPEKGTIDMVHIKMVVKEVEDDFLEISEEDAQAIDPKYHAGDEFIIPATVDDIKKATAMSVKSVLKQKFAEVEKGMLYEAFKDKINTMITGKVEKMDERGATVNIGKTSVFLPRNQMIGDEKFVPGDYIKLFVSDVASGSKGAHIDVSRANEGFLRCLFNEEIHEIYDGSIIIKGIAREAGERSKVAVFSPDPNIDPAGACIGPNGSRIQKIVGQLGNGNAKEKIDIIGYSENDGLFIMEALKPARVVGINVNKEEKSATAIVKDDSLSLAIGKKGVNARLAVKLTGFKIDIKTETEAYEEGYEFQSYEELAAQEMENKEKAIMEARAMEYENNNPSVLPGLPEGYVAPQERVYEEESNAELAEALEEASEKEELVAPVEETPVSEAPNNEAKEEAPVVKEEKETKAVKTTTSLEDLEKSLEQEANKQKAKANQKRRNNKKKEEEEEEEVATPISGTTGPRMSIYTEEELREMEEEESRESEEEEEDVDYDEYDDYYDDEN